MFLYRVTVGEWFRARMRRLVSITCSSPGAFIVMLVDVTMYGNHPLRFQHVD